MSGYDSVDKKIVLKRFLICIVIVLIAAVAGVFLARIMTRPHLAETALLNQQLAGTAFAPGAREDYVDPEAVPLFFYAGVTPEGDRTLALQEVTLAAQHGLHQFIVPIPAPWTEEEVAPILAILDSVALADPAASYFLQVDLNPPATWLARNPAEQVSLNDERKPFCSPSSGIWMDAARDALRRLMEALANTTHKARLIGVIPAALSNGQWHLDAPGYDISAANQQGFRTWLRGIYVTDETLQQAWGRAAQFGTVVIPKQPPADNLSQVFLSVPAQQDVIDFQNYVSESTADAIAALTAHIKEVAPRPVRVVAPYGFTMELLNNEAGHFGLAILTGSDVDGFVSPVSYQDRGTGGAGGFMGPVNTAHYHQKQWYIVDDTRTGVARDAITGAVSRLKGLRPEDVYSVQQRNFSAAVVHNLGLVWSDPAGEGWLHDDPQWAELAKLKEIYRKVREMHAAKAASPPAEEPEEIQDAADEAPELPAATDEVPAEDAGAQAPATPEEGDETPAASSEDEVTEPEDPVAAVFEEVAPPPPLQPVVYGTGMVVVVDEVSRFYQQCGQPINDILLHHNRDASMRAGVPTHFALLQDVLEGRTPLSPVYLFLNSFYLPQDQREVLHERLANEQACAIWVYAPGYVDEANALENVAATTRMNVVAFKAPEDAASQYLLQGWWMKPEETIGTRMLVQPLFYVEDADADVLALYTASRKTSVAVKYSDEGWTSVFVATPFLTAPLLREILRILEQPMVFRHADINHFDTTHVTGDLIAVHAKQVGERTVDLDQTYDVQDLLDPNIGWPRIESFLMPLDTGDTRLLELRKPR